MNPVILVGRRPDHGRRDDLWRWARARWETLLGWPIATGYHSADEQPEFCLSVASNRAARAAGEWDVALYVGADWLAAGAWQAQEAVRQAAERGQLVFAHDETVVLTEQATDRLLSLPPADPPVDLAGSVHRHTFSGVMAVPRALWDAAGGFDERFVGWGFDDLAVWMALDTLGGGYHRVPGRIAHLWHPQDRSLREDAPTHGPNMVLWERYKQANGRRPAMLALLSEPGGPLA